MPALPAATRNMPPRLLAIFVVDSNASDLVNEDVKMADCCFLPAHPAEYLRRPLECVGSGPTSGGDRGARYWHS